MLGTLRSNIRMGIKCKRFIEPVKDKGEGSRRAFRLQFCKGLREEKGIGVQLVRKNLRLQYRSKKVQLGWWILYGTKLLYRYGLALFSHCGQSLASNSTWKVWLKPNPKLVISLTMLPPIGYLSNIFPWLPYLSIEHLREKGLVHFTYY